MKAVVILAIILGMAFSFNLGIANADDLSDMKEQMKALQETINTLNAKIQVLESKQEAQAERVKQPAGSDLQETVNTLNEKIKTLETTQAIQAKEIKKVPEMDKKINSLKDMSKGLLDKLTIGGHLKLYMLDQSQGKHNGSEQHNNWSAGINHFYLYLTKELEDWLKLDIQTDLSVSASATPSVGSNITRASSASTTFKIHQAFFTGLLPKNYELKLGIFNPMFSEEYAKETWWHELYHQNDGLANLQTWHDQGVELYKNYDFDNWSLPAYFSVLGGNLTSSDSRFIDNNNNKAVLLHLAPEFFQSKFKLLGSFAYGTWDNKDDSDMYHALGGFEWKYQKFNLTGEYIYRVYQSRITTGTNKADGTNKGYWLRAMYTFDPRWRALVKYSHSNLYKTGLGVGMMSDTYDTTSLAVDFFLTPNSTIIGQYQYIDARRSDGTDKLKANRFTLGWRTTF